MCFLLILFFGIAAYSNTFNSPFHFDDIPSILEHRRLHPLNLGQLWNYMPPRFISYLSLALNIYISGFETWSFHILNLLIHILSAWVVFRLTLLILATPSIKDLVLPSQQNLFALAPALLFLTHPLQTQAVTYIVQRMASLATLFYLATLLMYLKARLEEARNYRLVFLFMLAAMLCKQISFTLPFAILLMDFYFFPLSEKETVRVKILRWLPYAAFLLILLAPYWITTYKNLIHTGELKGILPSSQTTLSRWDYLLTEFRVLRTYLRLLVLPIGQCLFYDYRLSTGRGDPDTWVAFTLLLSLFSLAIALSKKNRLLSFGILWFFLTLSVESTIVPLDDVIFEHRLYLPMFGFALALTSLLWRVTRSPKIFAAVLLSLVVILSGMTYFRNEVWKTKLALSWDIAKKCPNKGVSYAGLGDAYSREAKDDRTAVIYYEKALALGYVNPFGYYNLYACYGRLGDQKKSSHYDKLFRGFAGPVKDFASNYDHALAMISEGKDTEAIEAFKKAIRVDPSYPMAHIRLGETYLKMQREQEAIFSFKKAIEVSPLDKAGYDALALFYKAKGEDQKALAVMVDYVKCQKRHKPLFGG